MPNGEGGAFRRVKAAHEAPPYIQLQGGRLTSPLLTILAVILGCAWVAQDFIQRKIQEMTKRWRYEKPDGTPVWLAFDPDFPCIFCDQPVRALSLGGPAVCPMCDCGYTDGKQWDIATYTLLEKNARRRLAQLTPDPAWAEYERTAKGAAL